MPEHRAPAARWERAAPERGRKRRAPAMSQDDRRAAIIEATIPLMLADEPDVSTSKIATAAGIAEGTVFRAFRDKKELLLACAKQAMVADSEVQRIQQVDLTGPLPERLTSAVEVVGGYLDRIWRVVRSLQVAGVEFDHKHGQPKDGADNEEKRDGPIQMGRVSNEIARLFGAGADQLRADPELAARLLLGLVFSNRRGDLQFGPGSAVSSAELVDLFLHGVLNRHAKATTPDEATSEDRGESDE